MISGCRGGAPHPSSAFHPVTKLHILTCIGGYRGKGGWHISPLSPSVVSKECRIKQLTVFVTVTLSDIHVSQKKPKDILDYIDFDTFDKLFL